MTGMSSAALALAVAVLVGPGSAVVAARLAGLRPPPDPPSLADPQANQPVRQDPPPGSRSWSSHWPWRVRRPRPGDEATPGDRPGRRRLPLPLLAAIGTALLPVAFGGGLVLGVVMGVVAFVGTRWLLRKGARPAPDPLRLASCWDLLAACLRGGLPVPVAVRAVAAEVPAPADAALDRTAELLALGADPVSAWAPALAEPLTAELARGARRSARSGAALASVAEGLATAVRAGADDLAEARAQRAAVAVTGPLGLCFLPAFLCIGVVPVVIGLATRLMASW